MGMDDNANEAVVVESEQAPPQKKKKKKEQKPFDPLSDDPIVFKKVDFDSVPDKKAKKSKKGAKPQKKKAPKKVSEVVSKEAKAESKTEPETEKKKKKLKDEDKENKEIKPKTEPSSKEDPKEGKKKKSQKEEPPKDVSQDVPISEELREGKKKKSQKVEKEQHPKDVSQKVPISEDSKEGKKKKSRIDEKDEKTKDIALVEETETKTKKKGKREKIKDTYEKPKDTEVLGEPMQSDTGNLYMVVPLKKGSKLKGKGKTKGKRKDEKDLQQEISQVDIQASITQFLYRYASEHEIMQDDDEWTWESYTPTEDSEETKKEEQEKGKKQKKKKGGKPKREKDKEMKEKTESEATEDVLVKEKKGKGKKKKKEEVEPEPVPEAAPPVIDIMAEINRMKELAAAQALGIEVIEDTTEVVAPKKKKGGKKKRAPKIKLTAKELAELAEQRRIQEELEAIAAEEAERIRLIEAKKAAIAKEKREIQEQRIRMEQLSNSLDLIKNMQIKNVKKAKHEEEKLKWEHYLKCDGLPSPYICGQLSTYLHLWNIQIKTISMDEATVKTAEALKLLEDLTALIDNSLNAQPSQIENWKWIHRLFREHQQHMLDNVTYRIIRDIRHKLNPLDLSTAEFRKTDKLFALFLWLPLRLPVHGPWPRAPPQLRIDLDVPEMGMRILLPESFTCENQVIRTMHVKYDHLSDHCANYHGPSMPELYELGIKKITEEEWYSKLYYKFLNRDKIKKIKPEGDDSTETEEEIVDREAGIIPTVPYKELDPTASTHFIKGEDDIFLDISQNLVTQVEDHVVNLRKYIILGGVYFLNLLYQPPQSQAIVTMETTVTRHCNSKWCGCKKMGMCCIGSCKCMGQKSCKNRTKEVKGHIISSPTDLDDEESD